MIQISLTVYTTKMLEFSLMPEITVRVLIAQFPKRRNPMRTSIFRDRLGVVSTGSLLRSLPNPSSSAATMNLELLQSQSPRGFEVSADFEVSIRDTPADQTAFMTGGTGAEPIKKLVRLVLEPLNVESDFG